MKENAVAVADIGTSRYPDAPFSPSVRYPEYPYEDLSGEPNPVYAGVRECLMQLGLDQARAGRADWNPLGELIQPGMRVLVKPNLVRHYHPKGLDPVSIVTHGSVIRAIADYALKAVGETGEVVLADAPLQSCDFPSVLRLAGVDSLAEYYRKRGSPVEVRDLRLLRAVVEKRSLLGKVLVQQANAGDPLGYTQVDLGSKSLHARRNVDPAAYRVTCYDPSRMGRHHGRGRHEYVIANTLLDADVVINVPKMKTHHKAGITGALKNFIGINGHKDCLPHHAKGHPLEGGDEYARADWTKRLDSWLLDAAGAAAGPASRKSAAVLHRMLYAVHMRHGPESFWEGSWFGNDTISRTTVDLNRIVRYGTRGGGLSEEVQRPVFSLVDGVLAGEKDGPLAPTPKPAGLLVAGLNPAAVDAVLARLMGYRPLSIPTLRHVFAPSEETGSRFPLACFPVGGIEIRSRHPRWNGIELEKGGDSLRFEAHQGWKGHVEI